MKKHITCLIKDNKGSAMIEMIVSVFIILCIVVTCINALSFFAQYNNLSAVARRITRSIEISGIVDAQTYELLNELSENTTLTPELSVDAPIYFDAELKKIQLRETFTVILEDEYVFTILEPAFDAGKIEIKIPIRVKMAGMSEKYWK